MTKNEPLQSNQEDTAANMRHRAIDLYLAGEKPMVIARRLGRSRNWFYETLARYRQGGRAGLASRSRAPKRVHNRTDPAVAAAIVRIRRAIVSGEEAELRYAHIGAPLIASELERIQLTPPSPATINRILRQHGLTQRRRRKGQKQVIPTDYPWPCVTYPNQMHLFDFVTRTVGGQRFYGCHLLDQARHWPFLDIITSKSTANVCQFMVSAWQAIGLPQALYLDNDVVWRGSSSGQRTFSHIVRLCLLLGVEVIFTPPYTAKANPFIESFNSLWDDNFWQRAQFRDLTHLQAELPLFQHYCRHRRPLMDFDRATADLLFPEFVPTLLAADFCQHQQGRLPLTAGIIHFIRFVSANGTFRILNEPWQLDAKAWAGKTIRATLATQAQQLYVYHHAQDEDRPKLVTQFDYDLAEEVVPLRPQYQRHHLPLWPELD